MYRAIRTALAALLVALPFLAGSCASPGSGGDADLVLRNGKIVTLDPRYPEVRAMAVKDGRVIAVGFETIINRYIGPQTTVIDLPGIAKEEIEIMTKGADLHLRVRDGRRSISLPDSLVGRPIERVPGRPERAPC